MLGFFSNFKEEVNTKSRHNRAKVFLKSLLYFHASLRLIHGIIKEFHSMIVEDLVVLCGKVSSEVAQVLIQVGDACDRTCN